VVNIDAIMTLLDFLKSSTKAALSPVSHSSSEVNVTEDESHSPSSTSRFYVQPAYELEGVDSGLEKGGMENIESGKMLVKGIIRKPVVALLEHSKSPDPCALVLQVFIQST